MRMSAMPTQTTSGRNGVTNGKLVTALAIGVIGLLAISGCSSSTKTMNQHGVSYSYPASWNEIKDLKTSAQAGRQNWQQAVGANTTNLAILSQYTLTASVLPQNLASAKAQVANTVKSLATQSHGSVTSPVKSATTAGFPGFTAAVSIKPKSGPALQSTVWLFFDGNVEYFLNCQSESGQQSEVLAGCETIRSTFKVTK